MCENARRGFDEIFHSFCSSLVFREFVKFNSVNGGAGEGEFIEGKHW